MWHAHCRHLSASAVKEEVVLASILAAFRESTELQDQEQGDEGKRPRLIRNCQVIGPCCSEVDICASALLSWHAAKCRILAKVIATALRPGKEHTPEDIVSMIPLGM